MSSSNIYLRGLEYLESFQLPKPVWLDEIKQLGINYKVPIVDDDMGRFLRLICALKQPKSILEIGCGISYATHWMLLGSPKTKVIGLDYNQQRLDFCTDFLKKSGFIGNVILKRQWAKDFFLENNEKFDIIFQDSTKKDYGDMIDDCYQRLKPDGLLIVDNLFFNGKVFGLSADQIKKYEKGVSALKSFNKTISIHPGFECHFLAISDGVLIAQRKAE